MLALTVCIPAGWSAFARAADYPEMAPLAQYLSANQSSEVALARSAAPKSVAEHATVLTLTKHGYETAVKGSDGFVCFVERSWANDFDNGQFWNPRIRTPQCWNAAAASSLLKDYLNRTQWVLSGASKVEMLARTKAEFATHEVGPPAPGSMAYMLSKKQYINDPSPQGQPEWYPHVMFFVPATDGSPWGANAPDGPLFSATSDVEPVTTYFLLAPNWADGSPGPYAKNSGKAKKHHHG
ncbi:MAG TPA: hypothetical protein VIC29_16630 [Steroidobacteraceae bacterium]|jgi:hypothetical protein